MHLDDENEDGSEGQNEARAETIAPEVHYFGKAVLLYERNLEHQYDNYLENGAERMKRQIGG